MSSTATRTSATRDGEPSTSRRVAAIAAIAAGVAFIVKVALILVTANEVSATPMVVLYLGAIVLGLVAAGAYAASRDTTRPWKVGTFLLIAFAFLMYIVGLSDGVGELVASFSDEAYVQDEVPVAVIGLVWLAVGINWARS